MAKADLERLLIDQCDITIDAVFNQDDGPEQVRDILNCSDCVAEVFTCVGVTIDGKQYVAEYRQDEAEMEIYEVFEVVHGPKCKSVKKLNRLGRIGLGSELHAKGLGPQEND